ncbi:metalloregulator ArsR/SmtB family transcription factor [Streptomyces sp. NBC_01498]|uniref:ArsR/SmtB family transcription factor n=1 Tax=Streptomyces sp. NBC_01498 TaxID=2975870 RepID=UPI002E7AC1CC|nr:metalloregulator ArsR/SmtB family transcription factor [Streptomyces sp. NBC_01498]WTL28786.1 metalloregulator ArsR/SmtB family transcription factor [Streptomyces sp. NBC_01498]
MDDVFRALADPGRRRLLDSLDARDGQTLRELCAELDMARQSVSKHLAVLEAANLVVAVRRGREKLHYLNVVPINAIADRWMNKYDRARATALADLRTALESEPEQKPGTEPEENTMTQNERTGGDPAFVYRTYIRTTPEKLWRALTDPVFTRRYWGVTFASEWRAGSPMSWEQFGVTITDPEQVVLESEPYRRLSYTWHTMTPEFAGAAGLGEEYRRRAAAERRSKVTFEIEPVGETVKLTVTHDGFAPGSTILASVSEGWPALLSSLKTLLETGETLPEA